MLAGGNLDVADEVLAPNYVNVAMGGADIAGIKAMLAATGEVLKERRFEDEEFVAEGDAVFARFNYVLTLSDGTATTVRAMAYCRLANGRIVVNDVMSDPDLMQVLGPPLSRDGAARRARAYVRTPNNLVRRRNRSTVARPCLDDIGASTISAASDGNHRLTLRPSAASRR